MRSETPCNDSRSLPRGSTPSDHRPRQGRQPAPHGRRRLLSYFDEKSYQRAFTYQRKVVPWEDRFEGREVSLQFTGGWPWPMPVLVNGPRLPATATATPPSRRAHAPSAARRQPVTSPIDVSENLEIPPFGGQIDHLTYAGLYREVHLYGAALIATSRSRRPVSCEKAGPRPGDAGRRGA